MESGSNIITYQDADRNPRNLIYEYRRLNIDKIKNNYLALIGHQTRKFQKSIQMYHCIYNSLTEYVHLKIVA